MMGCRREEWRLLYLRNRAGCSDDPWSVLSALYALGGVVE